MKPCPWMTSSGRRSRSHEPSSPLASSSAPLCHAACTNQGSHEASSVGHHVRLQSLWMCRGTVDWLSGDCTRARGIRPRRFHLPDSPAIRPFHLISDAVLLPFGFFFIAHEEANAFHFRARCPRGLKTQAASLLHRHNSASSEGWKAGSLGLSTRSFFNSKSSFSPGERRATSVAETCQCPSGDGAMRKRSMAQ